MGVVANLLVKISGDSSELRKELASTQKQMRTAFGGEALKASEKTLRRVKLMSVGFLALGAASVKMAADVQQTRTALVSLLKSTEEADKLLKEVKTFAATTPFEFNGLSKAAQQMVAFGFEAKAVVPILNTVGDAVAGLGGDQNTMDSIVGVLGKIQTMGRVTSQEMMQLARQGVNAYQYLADASGKTVAQIQDDMKKGAVSSSDAIKAVVLGMNQQFAGGMEAQSKTMKGIWATVEENVKGVMRSIGTSITGGFNLEKAFGDFSEWLSKFTVEVDKSGLKQAIKELVPDSMKLSVIAFAAAILGKMVPALVVATKAAWAANAALIKMQLLTGGVMLAVGFLASELTGTTTVLKDTTAKMQDSFAKSGVRDKPGGRGTGNDRSRRGRTTSTSTGKGNAKPENVVEAVETVAEDPAVVAANKRIAELEKALKTLGNTSAVAAEKTGAAAKKASADFEALRRTAESTSKSIESAWLDMTGSQRDILDAWHRDQLEELEKSKAANANYQRDRTRLEETFQEKLRQLMHNEAKDRAATIKEITDSYKGMYDKLAEMGLKGSAKDLFGMEKAAADDIKAMSDLFAKMEADFSSATDAQKKSILDALNEIGAAYKVTAEGALDTSEEVARFDLERTKQLEDDRTEYHRLARGIQADIDKAYDELSLDQLKQTLGEKEALHLGHLEAMRVQMDTYMEAMKDAYAPIELMFANMAETFRVGFGDAISDVIMGVSTLTEAFEAMGRSIIQVFVDWASEKIAGMLMINTLEQQLRGETVAEEIAAEQAVVSAKTAMLAAETTEKIAAIGAVAAAQVTAEETLLAAGLIALEAFSIASIAQGAAVAAAWAAAAANVSLASFGSNAGPAMAGISAAHALTQTLSAAALAEGGLVTGPTLAMVGEGRYTEAVLPLSDKVMGRLADGINNAGGGAGTNVNIYGDINNASDEDRIFGGLFKDSRAALMGA